MQLAYKLCKQEVNDIIWALKSHINQCERYLKYGEATINEAEELITRVTRMKDLIEVFTNK